ncbi:MAG: hypothetical protein AAF074_21900 [Pseudomonadota bacterium]
MGQRRYKRRPPPKGQPEFRVLEGYDAETREEMAAILEKKIKTSRTPDMHRVQQELLDLIHGLELAYPDSERARIWHELKAEEPDNAECAHAFEIAAAADDPIAAARADDRVGPRLNGMLRNWWLADWRRKGRNLEPSLRTVEWDLLNQTEQDEVRAMLRHLASFERQFVQQGTPRKMLLDEALKSLAEVYLRHTDNWSNAVHEVPSSRTGPFIRFAVLALTPVVHYFEVTHAALGERWRRQCAAEAAIIAEMETATPS